jgi:DNA-binding response OmpR family regulator
MATVLVVDDEPSIVLPLRFLLEKQGHEVQVVSDGARVLPAVRDRTPDLILLDVHLPSRDGYDLCRAVRAEEGGEAVRIVMLTVNSREVDRAKGLALGADAYLTKPFAIDDVLRQVDELLRVR